MEPELPGMVCFCMEVTDKEICTAIQNGHIETVQQIGKLLGAGTGCGKCRPKIQALIQKEEN